jgi:hypothetical protein
MGALDFCPVAFNCFGGRVKFRLILALCIFTISIWALLFSPFGLTIPPFEFSFPNVLSGPSPRPPPPPIPVYNRPTLEEVGEPFTPGPPPETWEDAKKQVKDAFKYALDGYLEQAYPFDELRAASGGGFNK